MNYIAVFITQNLKFNMMWFLNELFQIYGVVSK